MGTDKKGSKEMSLLDQLNNEQNEYLETVNREAKNADNISDRIKKMDPIKYKIEESRNFLKNPFGQYGNARDALKYIPKKSEDRTKLLNIENSLHEYVTQRVSVLYNEKNALETLEKMKEEYGTKLDNAINPHGKNIMKDRERFSGQIEKITRYEQTANYLKNKIESSRDYGENLIREHIKGKDDEWNKLHSAIIVGMTSIFGGGVLYALSQTDPTSITTTGAFTAGAASPLVLMTLIGLGLFGMFFLVHHKLHE